MINLFRAEWSKTTGHRWVTSCLLWIFPAGAVGFMIIIGLILALSSSAREEFAADTLLWTDQMTGVWGVPNSPFGRLLLLGFTAVMFAGEYQWHTWKNVIPRNRRAALILVKFVTLGALVVFAFALMSVIIGLGMGLLVKMAGGTYGPALTGEVLGDFASDYTRQAVLAFVSTIIAAGYAALAAMLTRSILGGVLVGVGLTFAESLLVGGLILIAFFLKIPNVLHLYRLTPGYNLLNVNEWIVNNHSLTIELPYGDNQSIILSDNLAFSLLLLAVWVVGLIGLTIVLFRRQDIASA
ncbi:MAG: hypothetical protein JXJ20_08210 [Anaerolineae bacterium]|nr:hypothetical protein [Anaerolineae bacterium]